MTLSPSQLFHAGQLEDAVAESIKLVKRNPTETNLRFQLAELSCIAGDLDRAERQLETISNQDPNAAVGAALFRQLVRAELARRECFQQGRLPEFIGEPSASLKSRLRAVAELRSGNRDNLMSLISVEDEGNPSGWTVNGSNVTVLRDLDDLLAPVLEVHTSTGKYFWIHWNQILSLEVHSPKRAIDLLWRQATLSIESGPDGEVYLPAIYPSMDDAKEADQSFRMGRNTDWIDVGEGVVCGKGQKMLLVDEQDLSIMELEKIERNEGKS